MARARSASLFLPKAGKGCDHVLRRRVGLQNPGKRRHRLALAAVEDLVCLLTVERQAQRLRHAQILERGHLAVEPHRHRRADEQADLLERVLRALLLEGLHLVGLHVHDVDLAGAVGGERRGRILDVDVVHFVEVWPVPHPGVGPACDRHRALWVELLDDPGADPDQAGRVLEVSELADQLRSDDHVQVVAEPPEQAYGWMLEHQLGVRVVHRLDAVERRDRRGAGETGLVRANPVERELHVAGVELAAVHRRPVLPGDAGQGDDERERIGLLIAHREIGDGHVLGRVDLEQAARDIAPYPGQGGVRRRVRVQVAGVIGATEDDGQGAAALRLRARRGAGSGGTGGLLRRSRWAGSARGARGAARDRGPAALCVAAAVRAAATGQEQRRTRGAA